MIQIPNEEIISQIRPETCLGPHSPAKIDHFKEDFLKNRGLTAQIILKTGLLVPAHSAGNLIYDYIKQLTIRIKHHALSSCSGMVTDEGT
jgi:hypothetical protein